MSTHRTNKPTPTKPIASWQVLERQNRITGETILQLAVTYDDGKTRTLPAAFKSREALDKYISRFHPDYIGKERIV